MMKHYINKLSQLFLLLVISGVFAQGPPKGRERIKTLKVGFITEKLALTPAEAQQFWPVYNTHESALYALRRKERQQFGPQLARSSELSDQAATTLLNELISFRQERQQMELDYLKNLKQVLPDKKIVLLLKAEEDFKKRMLHEVRKRRGHGPR